MPINAVQIGELTKIFYNRLKIHVCRNGIVFMKDVREQKDWMEEFLRHGETVTCEVLDDTTVFKNMIEYMKKEGFSVKEMKRYFRYVTGKELNEVDC